MPFAKLRHSGSELDLERRAFFGDLFAASRPSSAASRGRMPADRIALLRNVAARWEGRLPNGAIPQIDVSDACALHGVCVAVCPTAALRRYSGDGHAGLEFEPAACIACGICAMVCPENALAIRALAAADGSASVARQISRHDQRACTRCDDEFAARAGDELCPACGKDIGLFANVFSARSDET